MNLAFARFCLSACCAIALAGCAALFSQRSTTIADGTRAQLTILESTDIHSNIRSYDYYRLADDPALGFERMATLVKQARAEFPNLYIKITAYDRSLGRQTTALSFIVNRPKHEPGFALERQGGPDRQQRYTLRSYALNQPRGERYNKR